MIYQRIKISTRDKNQYPHLQVKRKWYNNEKAEIDDDIAG
jgi:hypothetical protein